MVRSCSGALDGQWTELKQCAGASGEAYKIPKLKHVAQLPRLPSVDSLPAGSIAQVRQVTLSGQIVQEGNKSASPPTHICAIWLR
jgi:hypothetical protein